MNRNLKKSIGILLILMFGISILTACGGGNLSGKYYLVSTSNSFQTVNEARIKELFGSGESYIEFLSEGKCRWIMDNESQEMMFTKDGNTVTINPPYEPYEYKDEYTVTGKIDGNKITFGEKYIKMVFKKKYKIK